MLTISRHQRNKLRLDGSIPKSSDFYQMKYEKPTEGMAIPNLIIRRPSVVQVGKTSELKDQLLNIPVQGPAAYSALKGQRLSAITSSNNSSGETSPENNNYLRVSALFGNRWGLAQIMRWKRRGWRSRMKWRKKEEEGG